MHWSIYHPAGFTTATWSGSTYQKYGTGVLHREFNCTASWIGLNEVHLYDMNDERLKDNTPGSVFWNDGDGWRTWTYSKERTKYYFNDIPEDNIGDAITYTFESKGPEIDLTEDTEKHTKDYKNLSEVISEIKQEQKLEVKQEVEDTKKTPEEVIKTVPEPEPVSTEGKIPNLKDLDASQVSVGMSVLIGKDVFNVVAVHPNEIIVLESPDKKDKATFRFFEDNWEPIPNDSPLVPKTVVEEPKAPEAAK
jgi:hypothetical protein